jgi:hypothetical protein
MAARIVRQWSSYRNSRWLSDACRRIHATVIAIVNLFPTHGALCRAEIAQAQLADDPLDAVGIVLREKIPEIIRGSDRPKPVAVRGDSADERPSRIRAGLSSPTRKTSRWIAPLPSSIHRHQADAASRHLYCASILLSKRPKFQPSLLPPLPYWTLTRSPVPRLWNSSAVKAKTIVFVSLLLEY